MRIKKQLVKNLKLTSGLGNPCNYITIHETANTSRGADAAAHANLQARGNARNASWQWQVDDKAAIQSYPDEAKCWHAGDGTGPGNMQSIGIEICVNRDGNYAKALINAAILVRDLMVKHDIPLSRVVQHHHWSGKNCPTNLRRGNEWEAFKALIVGEPAKKPKPVKAKKRKPKKLPVLARNKRRGSYWVGLWQEFLRSRGHNIALDKIFGIGTFNATRAWQRSVGLKDDGVVGILSWSRAVLGVRPGQRAPSTKIWQRIAGLTGKHADGIFGATTTRWSKDVQRWLKVTPDAVIGNDTIGNYRKKA